MKVFFILFTFVICLSSSTVDFNKDETGTELFVSKKWMVHNKYAVLQIKDSIASLEIYAKYNGEYVPVNMSWNSKIEPEKYILKLDTLDSNKRVFKGNIIEIEVNGNNADIHLKYSFMGGFDLSFDKVNDLPEKFEHIRNHAYMFTGRNAVGYQFKTEGGYQNYDSFMKGNVLYKECDHLNFHDFVAKYDSVQQKIYKEIYTIHDSLKIQAVADELVEE